MAGGRVLGSPKRGKSIGHRLASKATIATRSRDVVDGNASIQLLFRFARLEERQAILQVPPSSDSAKPEGVEKIFTTHDRS